MRYTDLGCREGVGLVLVLFVLLYITKMVYYCRKSRTRKIELTTFLLLCLNAFQSHIWMMNKIKYKSPNFRSYRTVSTAQ